MGQFVTLQSASIALAILALLLTLGGAWISVKWGVRKNGWSDGFAVTLLLSMGALTIWTFFQFAPIEEDVGGIYTTLVFWYMFLFFIGQRLLVTFIKQLRSN